MSVAAKADAANEQSLLSNKDQESTITSLKRTVTDEIVIALCGPLGSPVHSVAEAVKDAITERHGYACTIIKLSDFIKENYSKTGLEGAIPDGPRHERIERLIDAGDRLRANYGPSVLADLAISAIRVDRERHRKSQGTEIFESRRVCHIIDSIKNQAELDLLREVYREVLYVIGVFSPVSVRERNLSAENFPKVKLVELMERDAKGADSNGQTVGDTFPQSDFFLRMGTNAQTGLKTRVERCLNLILSTDIVTPTREESAMYAAASAASGSACLSRQVGAAVTDADGSVLAVGWNDVPRPFGGLYQTDRESDPDGSKDLRCYNKDGGKCFNDEEKSLLAQSIAESLGSDLIPADKFDKIIERIASDRKLQGLIEFSRAIHAEMYAILSALKVAGSKVQGGSIYVTTYPCHGCARHIIASGISEVYYIEPYRKSLAVKLHDDAITESEDKPGLVKILPYEGVAPSRYMSIFQMKPNSRKVNGKRVSIALRTASPKMEKSLQSLPELEAMVVKKLAERGLVPDVQS